LVNKRGDVLAVVMNTQIHMLKNLNENSIRRLDASVVRLREKRKKEKKKKTERKEVD
jgi:hypothetical protein